MTTIEHIRPHQSAHPAWFRTAARWFSNWQARRQVSRLTDFETRLLDDMGVTRDEVRWAAQLPLSVNAAWELRHRSRTRRLAESSIR
ncbi:MAG: DUF1127 domain-containing protein [Pseudomonadota bacterium]